VRVLPPLRVVVDAVNSHGVQGSRGKRGHVGENSGSGERGLPSKGHKKKTLTVPR
jgi:hypothetical protein